MGKFIINYTDTQKKAVEAHIMDCQAWLQEAWNNKARQGMDNIITAFTDRNPKKMALKDKEDAIRPMVFEPYSESRQMKDISKRRIS